MNRKVASVCGSKRQGSILMFPSKGMYEVSMVKREFKLVCKACRHERAPREGGGGPCSTSKEALCLYLAAEII